VTVEEIKAAVMFQTNNDTDDLEDFLPYLNKYIDEAYDRLVYAWAKEHPSDESEDWPLLAGDTDEPLTPEWTHRGLVDWATWLVYRNGNPQKQNRGYAYREAFESLLNRITSEGGKNGRVKNFFNIPR
jgi:hypothetical protein